MEAKSMEGLSKIKKCAIYLVLAGTITAPVYKEVFEDHHDNPHLPERPSYNLILDIHLSSISRSAVGATAIAIGDIITINEALIKPFNQQFKRCDNDEVKILYL